MLVGESLWVRRLLDFNVVVCKKANAVCSTRAAATKYIFFIRNCRIYWITYWITSHYSALGDTCHLLMQFTLIRFLITRSWRRQMKSSMLYSVKGTHLVSVARTARNRGPGCSPGTRTDLLPARRKPWEKKDNTNQKRHSRWSRVLRIKALEFV